MVLFLIVVLARTKRRWQVRRAGRRRQSEQLAKGARGDAPRRLVQTLRIAFGHVESAVRPPVESVQAMFEIAEIGIEADVFVGLVVAVGVADDGQVGRVGDPQVVAAPSQSLDRVQAGGEAHPIIGKPVTVAVEQDPHRVARRVRLRLAVLRAHADAQPAVFVEGDRAGVAHQRFAREQGHLHVGGDEREVLVRGGWPQETEDRHHKTAKAHVEGVPSSDPADNVDRKRVAPR